MDGALAPIIYLLFLTSIERDRDGDGDEPRKSFNTTPSLISMFLQALEDIRRGNIIYFQAGERADSSQYV